MYYGQYNLNHDKSDWQEIIGMEGVDGFTPSNPIAFEFLNNTQPLCLFQGQSDLDAQAASEFDNALEFNYPAKTGGDDTLWANAPTAKKNGFKRLWGGGSGTACRQARPRATWARLYRASSRRR